MPIRTETLWNDLLALRANPPLVHNISNYVVMNPTANALLALGASPVMAHAEAEVAAMVDLAGALVLNIGTLSDPWIAAMHRAATRAKQRGIPLVLDPVGAGATPYRTDTVAALLNTATPTLIRANASEILAVSGTAGGTRGVDSTASADDALEAARRISRHHGCVVCVSGATDHILAGEQHLQIHNGDPLMARVTGMGCTASALCGAFLAVNPDPTLATAHAMAIMGIAGELAAERAAGPGSFQMHFLDALYRLESADVEALLRVDAAP